MEYGPPDFPIPTWTLWPSHWALGTEEFQAPQPLPIRQQHHTNIAQFWWSRGTSWSSLMWGECATRQDSVPVHLWVLSTVKGDCSVLKHYRQNTVVTAGMEMKRKSKGCDRNPMRKSDWLGGKWSSFHTNPNGIQWHNCCLGRDPPIHPNGMLCHQLLHYSVLKDKPKAQFK